MKKYVDEEGIEIKPLSKEYLEILSTIVNSPYYTDNPEDACLFVPPVDTLNENTLRKDKISQILSSLPQ